MTTKEQSLERLIERVKAATGPSPQIDAEIYATIGGAPHTTTAGARTIPLALKGDPKVWPEYTASIDAALALVERVLPGWHIAMGTVGETDTPWACLTEPEEPCRDFPVCGIDIPNALLLALLQALKETSNDHE